LSVGGIHSAYFISAHAGKHVMLLGADSVEHHTPDLDLTLFDPVWAGKLPTECLDV
jgi:hypothetical protein